MLRGTWCCHTRADREAVSRGGCGGMGGGGSAVAAGGRGGTGTQLVYDCGRDGTLCGRACTLHSTSHTV